MRPVNLIPPEERPGGHRPLRSGPLAYILVGFLAAAVIAITALVVLGNSVAEKKVEVAQLEQEQAQITAKAQELSSYIQFANVREQRLATVTSLADSRFDWARILHELSLVIPSNVQLTSLSGSASSEVSTAGGAGIPMRSQIPGPALEMVGCTTSPGAVAGFVESVKDIDGVTRVGVQGTSISSGESSHNATAAGTCSEKYAAQFQLVAAFDAAPVPPSEEAGEVVAPETTTTETTSESSTETTSGESSSEESSSTESSSSGGSEAD